MGSGKNWRRNGDFSEKKTAKNLIKYPQIDFFCGSNKALNSILLFMSTLKWHDMSTWGHSMNASSLVLYAWWPFLSLTVGWMMLVILRFQLYRAIDGVVTIKVGDKFSAEQFTSVGVLHFSHIKRIQLCNAAFCDKSQTTIFFHHPT